MPFPHKKFSLDDIPSSRLMLYQKCPISKKIHRFAIPVVFCKTPSPSIPRAVLLELYLYQFLLK